MSRIRNDQIVIAALSKAFAYRTVQDATSAMPNGFSRRIKATIEIDGVVTRGQATETSASAAPLFEAMLALFARGCSAQELAGKRRAAMKMVKAAEKESRSMTKHLSEAHPEEAAVLASIRQEAAEKLPKQIRSGSISFKGEAAVVKVA